MAYRNYSDEDKAVALAYYDACNNAEMTARECKIPSATVKLWIANRDAAPSAPTPESVAEKKTALADKLEDLAHAIVDKAPTKIDDAPLAASMTAAGIAIDKMRLLREQATSISTQAEPKSVEERDAEAIRLLEQVQLRVVNGGG